MAKRPDVLTMIVRPETTGCVLDHPQPVLLCYLQDWFHIRAQSKEVDGDDGLGLLCDPLTDSIHIDIEGAEVDIAENGCGAGVFHGVCRCNKGKGGKDNLISGPNIQGNKSNT